MFDPLYAQVIAWVGLVLLLVLCLPFAWIQKMVLEVSAWGLRLALIAVLVGAGYLWFRPQDLPVQVVETINSFPSLSYILPNTGTQHFGICLASVIVIAFLPLLAILDVTRKLAGRRLHRLRALAAGPVVVEQTSTPEPIPIVRRVDRKSAAATLAGVGTRKPAHAVNHAEL